MTPLAIATLVTSMFCLFIGFSAAAKNNSTTYWQRFLGIGGLFGTVWSLSFLLMQ